MHKPFFRADQVGSLLRPPELIAARQQYQQGQIDKAALRQYEDTAIAEAVRRQEQCGFNVVVDGEYRRENWWIDFVQGLSGVEIRDGNPTQAFVAPVHAQVKITDPNPDGFTKLDRSFRPLEGGKGLPGAFRIWCSWSLGNPFASRQMLDAAKARAFVRQSL